MSSEVSLIEQEYQSRMQLLSVRERIDRSMAMLKWTREMLARQIVAEHGPVSDEKLKWLVALRLYGADPITRGMIERKLADVPD